MAQPPRGQVTPTMRWEPLRRCSSLDKVVLVIDEGGQHVVHDIGHHFGMSASPPVRSMQWPSPLAPAAGLLVWPVWVRP